MSHARAAIAGVLSAAVIAIVVSRGPEDDELMKAGIILLSIVGVLIVPDFIERIRRDKEED